LEQRLLIFTVLVLLWLELEKQGRIRAGAGSSRNERRSKRGPGNAKGVGCSSYESQGGETAGCSELHGDKEEYDYMRAKKRSPFIQTVKDIDDRRKKQAAFFRMKYDTVDSTTGCKSRSVFHSK
jgi:hypothetical protein